MLQRFFILLLVGTLLLSGCGVVPSTSNNAKLSTKMSELPSDASIEDMVKAFEEDYLRAAQQAGITADHNNLEFKETSGMAMIDLTPHMTLMIDPPSTFHRIWYAGYAESSEWMRQEAVLALMAADNTLSLEDSEKLIDDIFKKAVENQDNMPSAVHAKTTAGVRYSMSTTSQNSVSFHISY